MTNHERYLCLGENAAVDRPEQGRGVRGHEGRGRLRPLQARRPEETGTFTLQN